MRPAHEAQYSARERHRKQRHARKHADRMDTATLGAVVAALGAGSVDDWLDDTTEHHKPARREQRGAEG